MLKTLVQTAVGVWNYVDTELYRIAVGCFMIREPWLWSFKHQNLQILETHQQNYLKNYNKICSWFLHFANINVPLPWWRWSIYLATGATLPAHFSQCLLFPRIFIWTGFGSGLHLLTTKQGHVTGHFGADMILLTTLHLHAADPVDVS